MENIWYFFVDFFDFDNFSISGGTIYDLFLFRFDDGGVRQDGNLHTNQGKTLFIKDIVDIIFIAHVIGVIKPY